MMVALLAPTAIILPVLLLFLFCYVGFASLKGVDPE